jgi:hypothetical protein
MPFIQLERGEGRSVAFTEPTDAPASRRHEILFCPDDAANVDGFARYVAAALNAADAAIVPVTESHRTHLLQELRTQGVDIEGAIERGTCLTQVLENGDIRYRARVDASGRAR